jgi:hypothetical protein
MATLTLVVPTDWPFNSPVVPASAMPSGTSYIPDSNGQIIAKQQDVPILLGYGFSVVTATDTYMSPE